MRIPEMLMQRYNKEHLSYSSLKKALTDIALFDLHMKGKVDYKSDALEFGSMYDAILFDLDKAKTTYKVLSTQEVLGMCSGKTASSKRPEATTEFKEIKEKMRMDLFDSGVLVCSQEDWDQAIAMVERLRVCGILDTYLKGEYQKEVYGEINGVIIKGYLDCLGSGFISDSKSTRSVDGFRYDVNKLCYDIQAYLYCKLTGIDDFYWVVQEKTYPYLPAVVKCSQESLFRGEMKFFNAITKISAWLNDDSPGETDYITFEV